MLTNAEQGWMLLLFVAVNFAIAGLGSRLGERGHGSEVWFESLKKPPGYPSPTFFSQVWTLVAIATGVAGWLIWSYMVSGGGITALAIYGFQLLMLATWQGETIGLRRLRWGMTVGGVLLAIVTLTMLAALPVPGWAWCWLVPLWLLVAWGLRLNAALYRLNYGPAPTPPQAAPQPPPPTEPAQPPQP
ncbi:MAG: TspO/MBR family protein [Terriglobales bacterium]